MTTLVSGESNPKKEGAKLISVVDAITNRKNHQNSERTALPRKTAYSLKHVLTDCVKLITRPQHELAVAGQTGEPHTVQKRAPSWICMPHCVQKLRASAEGGLAGALSCGPGGGGFGGYGLRPPGNGLGRYGCPGLGCGGPCPGQPHCCRGSGPYLFGPEVPGKAR